DFGQRSLNLLENSEEVEVGRRKLPRWMSLVGSAKESIIPRHVHNYNTSAIFVEALTTKSWNAQRKVQPFAMSANNRDTLLMSALRGRMLQLRQLVLQEDPQRSRAEAELEVEVVAALERLCMGCEFTTWKASGCVKKLLRMSVSLSPWMRIATLDLLQVSLKPFTCLYPLLISFYEDK